MEDSSVTINSFFHFNNKQNIHIDHIITLSRNPYVTKDCQLELVWEKYILFFAFCESCEIYCTNSFFTSDGVIRILVRLEMGIT